MTGPTPSVEWVEAGDRCVVWQSGWHGTVIKIIPTLSLPTAVVKWDQNGHIGRVLITQLRKVA